MKNLYGLTCLLSGFWGQQTRSSLARLTMPVGIIEERLPILPLWIDWRLSGNDLWIPAFTMLTALSRDGLGRFVYDSSGAYRGILPKTRVMTHGDI